MNIKYKFKKALKIYPWAYKFCNEFWFFLKLTYQSFYFFLFYPKVKIYKNKLNTDYTKYKSQFFQDRIIEGVLSGKKNGFFVDIGANRYDKNSNSYYFEKYLGWHGLAIDPIAKFERDWKSKRKKSIFMKFAVGNANRKVDFVHFHTQLEDWEDMLSGLVGKVRSEDLNMSHEIISVKMRKLKDLLKEAKVKKIDFMSIDVEGSEMQVLAGSNFVKYRPSVILIENTKNILGSSDIRIFMKENKYKFYARISTTDDLYICNSISF